MIHEHRNSLRNYIISALNTNGSKNNMKTYNKQTRASTITERKSKDTLAEEAICIFILFHKQKRHLSEINGPITSIQKKRPTQSCCLFHPCSLLFSS